jgi:NHL repeat
MSTIDDLDDFQALEPFFRIIQQGLDGLADGDHFFDLLAEDVVIDYIITTPGYPRHVEGRHAVGAGQMYAPDGVAVDRSENVYVAEASNNRIDEFSSSGSFDKAWGWGVNDGAGQFETCTTSCRNGQPGGAAGQLSAPEGVAVDDSGNVYVADHDGERIDEFAADVPPPPAIRLREGGVGV